MARRKTSRPRDAAKPRGALNRENASQETLSDSDPETAVADFLPALLVSVGQNSIFSKTVNAQNSVLNGKFPSAGRIKNHELTAGNLCNLSNFRPWENSKVAKWRGDRCLTRYHGYLGIAELMKRSFAVISSITSQGASKS